MPRLSQVKDLAKKLSLEMPYQAIKDSPTIKYYTQWQLFDKCVEASTEAKAPLGVDEYDIAIHSGFLAKNNGMVYGDAETGISPSESKIVARHLSNLNTIYGVDVNGGAVNLRVMLSHGLPKGLLSSNHLVFNVGEGSIANISLSILGGEACGTNIVEFNVNEGSILNLFIRSVNDAPSFTLIRVNEGKGARVNSFSIIVGGEMTHHREDYILMGARSLLNSRALEVGVGKSRIDYMVNAIHVGEYSESYSVTQGVALDSSTVIHRGFGRISESGKWSSTNIEGKVFIGSAEATGMSVPVIMVDTGDVGGARHSASDASLDEQQEIYLRMRGLSREEAIRLVAYDIVMGFLDSVDPTFIRDSVDTKALIRRLIFST